MKKQLVLWGICLACGVLPLAAQARWPMAALPAAPVLQDTAVLAPRPTVDSLSTDEIFRRLALPDGQGGQVRVVQEPRIARLLDAYRQQYDVAVIPGFRVRIFSATGNDARQRAHAAMAAFSEEYPEVTPYLSYDEPYFKIYVGDFRIKTDALCFQRRIAPRYPDAFISADMIRVRPAVAEAAPETAVEAGTETPQP